MGPDFSINYSFSGASSSSSSSMHSYPSSPSQGRSNRCGWLGNLKERLNPTKIETAPPVLLDQPNHAHHQMQQHQRLRGGDGRGASSLSTKSTKAPKKYYIEFPNRIEITGPSSSSSNLKKNKHGMLLKGGIPQNEEALKEWIWSNYKDKLLDSMSIVEEDDQQQHKQQESCSEDDKCGMLEPTAHMEGEESSTMNDDDEENGDLFEGPSVLKKPKHDDREMGQHSADNHDIVVGHTPTSTATTSATTTTERSQIQKRLDLMDEVTRVQRQFVQSESAQVVFGCMLDCLLRLTESEYGFINELKYDANGEMYLSSQAITDNSWSASTQKFFQDNVKRGLRFYNMKTLFGIVVTTKQPVISNDPKNDSRGSGIPEGHPAMDSFLGIPFFKKDGEISGMVGIANKPGGYSQEDIDFLGPFTVTCSYLVQAYWQIRENKHLINTLEEKVAGRTHELKKANRNLEEANRRVVKASELQLQHFACMSHEIRTPLNCIVGLSSVLQESDLTPMQQESLRMIVSSGDLLLTVVNDVLDFAKLETGNVDIEIQRSNLQETLNSIVHSIQTRAEAKNVTFHTFYDLSVPKFIQTDSRRLQQILFNLLGNAVKFSGEDGGKVELRVTLTNVHHVQDDPQDDEELSASVASFDPDCSASLNSSISESGSGSRVGDVRRALRYPPISPLGASKSTLCPMHHSADLPGEPSCPIHEDVRSGLESPAYASMGNTPSCPIHQALSNSTLATINKDEPDQRLKAASPSLPMTSEMDSEEIKQPANTTLKQVLRFVIKDYGKGIAKEDFKRIFKPFLQASSETEQVYGGTGLGLAIVSKLVNGLGGTISVDSQVGEWTEFTVDLPCEEPATDIQSISRQLRPVRVVLVQENNDYRRQVEHVFRGCNVAVESVSIIEEIGTSTGGRSEGPIVCLANEDRYSKPAYDNLASQFRTVLLTTGPKYSVKESQGHFRSLCQVLPSVLMESIVDSVSTAIASRKDACLRLTRKSSVEAANSIPFKELRVLIAEDNKINQKVLLRILKRLGFENVDIVDNGQKAVDSEASKPYDVVLMDMQMPVMDGIDACRLIAKRDGEHPRAKVIFVTAHVSASFIGECEKAGGSGFIPKPFNIRQIEKCFQNLQKSGFYYEMVDGNSESKSGMKLDASLTA